MGRRSELNVFRGNLARKPGDPHYQFLFHVHGNAGVGKTWLVRQWEDAAAEAGAATAYLDDSVHSPLGAMETISAQPAGRAWSRSGSTDCWQVPAERPRGADRARRRTGGTRGRCGRGGSAGPGVRHAARAGGAGRPRDDVLALRPGPRLLLGAARLLRQIVTVLNARSEQGDSRRIAWSLRFLGPLRRILDRLPEAGRRTQGGDG